MSLRCFGRIQLFSDEILEEALVTELDKRLANENGIHVWLSLPLLYQGQLIGALNLGRGIGQPFTTDDVAITHDIANQLAIVLQQTRLYNALQDQLAEREKLIAQNWKPVMPSWKIYVYRFTRSQKSAGYHQRISRNA